MSRDISLGHGRQFTMLPPTEYQRCSKPPSGDEGGPLASPSSSRPKSTTEEQKTTNILNDQSQISATSGLNSWRTCRHLSRRMPKIDGQSSYPRADRSLSSIEVQICSRSGACLSFLAARQPPITISSDSVSSQWYSATIVSDSRIPSKSKNQEPQVDSIRPIRNLSQLHLPVATLSMCLGGSSVL